MTLSGGAIAGICIGSYIVAAFLLVRIVPIRCGVESVRAKLRSRFAQSMKHSSHRGGSLTGPENTMFAFRRAIADGHTDMLEMDVNISADGVPIVSHDLSLERICDPPYNGKLVADLVMGGNPSSLPQVKRHVQLHFPSETKGRFYDADSVAGDPIPVDDTTRLLPLSEVFDAFPNTMIHLDIKAESTALTNQVVDLIEAYQRQHLTILGTAGGNAVALQAALARPSSLGASTQQAAMNPADAKQPAEGRRRPSNEATKLSAGATATTTSRPRRRRDVFRTFATLSNVLLVYVLYYIGLLPLVPLSFDVFSIPGPTEVKGRQFGTFFGPWKAKVLMFILRSPTLWRHLQRRGIAVIVWVLNDEEEFVEASTWPINGIMTDDPIGLRKFFEARPTSEILTW